MIDHRGSREPTQSRDDREHDVREHRHLEEPDVGAPDRREKSHALAEEEPDGDARPEREQDERRQLRASYAEKSPSGFVRCSSAWRRRVARVSYSYDH
jgi:hypothetical protein